MVVVVVVFLSLYYGYLSKFFVRVLILLPNVNVSTVFTHIKTSSSDIILGFDEK